MDEIIKNIAKYQEMLKPYTLEISRNPFYADGYDIWWKHEYKGYKYGNYIVHKLTDNFGDKTLDEVMTEYMQVLKRDADESFEALEAEGNGVEVVQ